MFQINEIIWAHIRGFPWWPGRIVNPTSDQLNRLSVDRIPPDHRLVWFFNDKDRYNVINVKNLLPFRDHEFKPQNKIKNKASKTAAQLAAAFQQASAEYQRHVDLDDEEHLIGAVVIQNSTATKPRSSAIQPSISKKTKDSSATASLLLERSQPVQSKKDKGTKLTVTDKDPPRTGPRRPRHIVSHKKTQSTARTSADAESDRLSTHCNPSPCDRSSQETGIDSRANITAIKDNPPRSNLLRLRIREKRISTASENQNGHPPPHTTPSEQKVTEEGGSIRAREDQFRKKEKRFSVERKERVKASRKRRPGDSSGNDDRDGTDGTDLTRGDKKRRASELPPKLRHSALDNGEHVGKRRRLTATNEPIPWRKLGMTQARLPDDEMEPVDTTSEEEDAKVASAKLPPSAPKPSAEAMRIRESERESRPDGPVRRSRRMRRVSSKMAGTDDGSNRDSEDDGQRPVASKRSRGVEAPRMSDGQRRFHVRREGNEKGSDVAGHVVDLDGGKMSDRDLDEATKAFQDLSKDECVKVILKLREALRRKSVQLWLRGRKLVEAREVLRTEEGLIKACESRIEKAEKFIRWSKKYEGEDKGEGSRFAKMEMKVHEECQMLFEVYFDRRRVSLKNIGQRILKASKEMAPYSHKVADVLLDVLVLWLDLTSS